MVFEQRSDVAGAGQRFDADRDTFESQRIIVLACHNQTSINRLLEAQDLFRGDFRVRFICALGDHSRFSAGVERLLRHAGIDRIMSWSSLKHEQYDLVLSASENIDFTTTSGPVVLLPHGIGFNKFVATDGTRLAGLPSPAALRSGRILVVLSHSEQEEQVRTACPEIAGHTIVTGDPTFDRLVASMPLRERYRRLLGTGERRLVLLASTWGRESVLGRQRVLPRRLLAELPYDSYQVCMVIHPNVWAQHDARHLAIYFADALDSGVLLIPPESGWHAALVAADHVITDHGSLALYAAGLGKPLLLTNPATETVPGTPIDALPRTTAHLDTDGDLLAQLDTPTTHDASDVIDRAFAHVGEATERLHDALYRVLDLAPPEPKPALCRAPDPQPLRYRPASAFRVHAELTALDTVSLDRYPAAVRRPHEDYHLVVEEAESNLRLVEKASVLCRDFRTDLAEARAWAISALTAYPEARLAAGGMPGGCVVMVRDGRHALITSPNPHAEVSVLASAAYHHLLAGRFTSDEFTVQVGPHRIPVRLDVTTDPAPPTGA